MASTGGIGASTRGRFRSLPHPQTSIDRRNPGGWLLCLYRKELANKKVSRHCFEETEKVIQVSNPQNKTMENLSDPVRCRRTFQSPKFTGSLEQGSDGSCAATHRLGNVLGERKSDLMVDCKNTLLPGAKTGNRPKQSKRTNNGLFWIDTTWHTLSSYDLRKKSSRVGLFMWIPTGSLQPLDPLQSSGRRDREPCRCRSNMERV